MRMNRSGLASAFLAVLFLLPTSVWAQTETIEYYGLDAIGSVRIVFDANGTILGRMDYGPFGQELTGGTGLPHQRFAGLFRDGEAGLDHAQARSYQVRTGRFSTVDPVYADVLDPQQWNRYAYSGNQPTVYVDPSGLFYIPVTTSAIVADFGNALTDPNRTTTGTGQEKDTARPDEGAAGAVFIHNVPAFGSGATLEKDPWIIAGATSTVILADDVTGVGAVDDVVIPVVLAVAVAYDITQRTFVTYTLRNSRGQVYVGRTSGFGTPQDIVNQRYASHHMRPLGFGNPQVDRAVQGLAGLPAIRGREQQLIDSLGGVGSPTVANSIRAVAPYNPFGRATPPRIPISVHWLRSPDGGRVETDEQTFS